MKEICVVYLAYQPISTAFYRRFIESYNRHPAGIDHTLVILAKGYTEPWRVRDDHQDAWPKEAEIYETEFHGFDIGSYFAAAHTLVSQYKYFLFLNSYSQINGGCGELKYSPAKGWLKIMHDWITEARFPAGLVGCTGSWETAANLPRFPNPHIRTNAFMIRGEDFLKCEQDVSTKEKCNLFEAGENSLTRQIEAMGKKVLVAGKDKTAFEKDRWKISGTYRVGQQENLLISDNRTDHYQYGDLETREYLRQLAWGA